MCVTCASAGVFLWQFGMFRPGIALAKAPKKPLDRPVTGRWPNQPGQISGLL
jgi:hypothetical protein